MPRAKKFLTPNGQGLASKAKKFLQQPKLQEMAPAGLAKQFLSPGGTDDETALEINPMKSLGDLLMSKETFVDDYDDPVVQATASPVDAGVQHVVKHGGLAPEGSCRGSLRLKEKAYDLVISRDVIKVTTARMTNSGYMSGKKIWRPAHTKLLFPEHITEVDYYSFDTKIPGKWDLACCSFRCPRVSCCKVKLPKWRRGKKTLVIPKEVEPCQCEMPKCMLCSGLNPLTAALYVALLAYCFFMWYTAMLLGVETNNFVFVKSIEYILYAVAALAFLLICEGITLRNLGMVEKETIRQAEEEIPGFHEIWEHHVSESGREFYYHRDSHKIEWDLPEVEHLWVKKKEKNGEYYYFNTKTKESQWVAPKEYKSPDKRKPKTFGKEEDDGLEAGGKRMSGTMRNIRSVEAIKASVKNHHHACVLTCCAFIWHALFVLLVGGAAMGVRYKWDGKLPQDQFGGRRLAAINETCRTGVPVLPEVQRGKLWCEVNYYRMAQGKLAKGKPYYDCPAEKIEPCTTGKNGAACENGGSPAGDKINGGTKYCKCSCQYGFAGERCQIKLESCPDAICKGKGTADGLLTQDDGTAGCSCICSEGYQGKYCTKDMNCKNGADGKSCNNGTAAGIMANDYDHTKCSCKCDKDYEGDNCQFKKCTKGKNKQDYCKNDGEPNGTLSTGCNCICTNFIGDYCEISLQCKTGKNGNVCQNGGTPEVGTFNGTDGSTTNCRCVCPGGFTGDNCEFTKCTTGKNGQPCKNNGKATGTVVNGQITGCGCDCEKNFIGDNCELSLQCKTGKNGKVCQNGGTPLVGTYNETDGSTPNCKCDCPQTVFTDEDGYPYSYPGDYCERPRCTTHKNGLSCKNGGGATGYKKYNKSDNFDGNLDECGCNCKDTGYGGPNCQLPPCKFGKNGKPCLNGATPYGSRGEAGQNTTCGCRCDEGFGGANCELTRCTTGSNGKACVNDGAAQGYYPTNQTNVCSCSCKAGWGGVNCEIALDCTAGPGEKKCENGGQHYGKTLNCMCHCRTGWKGDNCEISQPYWYCPEQDAKSLETDPDGHLHRADNKCGRCHSRFMGPWVWVMFAIVVEALIMTRVACITRERKRLGRITAGRYVARKVKPAVYDRVKGTFERGRLTMGDFTPHAFRPGRFRFIEPQLIQLAKLIFTDRSNRKWEVYLTQEDAHAVENKFFQVQSQGTRQRYASHSAIARP